MQGILFYLSPGGFQGGFRVAAGLAEAARAIV